MVSDNEQEERAISIFRCHLVLIMNDEDQMKANNLRLRNCFIYLTVLISFVLSADGNKR